VWLFRVAELFSCDFQTILHFADVVVGAVVVVAVVVGAVVVVGALVVGALVVVAAVVLAVVVVTVVVPVVAVVAVEVVESSLIVVVVVVVVVVVHDATKFSVSLSSGVMLLFHVGRCVLVTVNMGMLVEMAILGAIDSMQRVIHSTVQLFPFLRNVGGGDSV